MATWITQVGERARARLTTARKGGSVPPFVPGPDEKGVVLVHPASTVEDGIPRGIKVAGAWAWRIVLFILAGYLLLQVISTLRLVVIPVAVAMLLAALLEPAAGRLRRHGVPRSLAAAIVLVGGLIVVFGGLGVIIYTFIAQFDNLAEQVRGGLNEIRHWLSYGPLHISEQQFNNAVDQLQRQVTANRGALTSGALSTATTLGEVLTGFFLVLFVLFFLLRDGAQIWHFLCRLLPGQAQLPVARAGYYSWFTLVSYVRATVLVAFVDAVGIGIGLVVLRVPLALPLAALVFLGAFIPVVGATLSGTVAVLVALVTNGPVSALLVLAVVIAVQQLEGHVLQPLIMGRAVALHPLSVILAITTGVVVAGIVGGLVAVPLLAIGNTAVRYLARYPDGEPTPEGEAPGTEPTDEGGEDGTVEAEKQQP
ncbi:AI-2E family transporter [Dactylosporangium sp. AC04546]|uniref:AI-2E family transporter n=1 Tax=Dactylosporangium sp. AC04546 TaxID=2862460 RepID=UPI001EDF8557|nr:AI-2E family transporter [Dactylosporangium sp. AC04546]WVK85956.1 AI-2E family transporter [Dactylosporangium sp. AC04546]